MNTKLTNYIRPLARISFERQFTVSSILTKRFHPRRAREILLQQQQHNPPVGEQRPNPYPYEGYFSRRIRPVCLPDPELMAKHKYLVGFNDIPELENADENVRKLFSLEMASNKDVRNARKEVYKEMYDTELEADIAYKTNTIREMVIDLKSTKYVKNKTKKVYLIYLINKRKDNLKTLMDTNLLKYKNIIEKLDIPPLQSPHEPWNMNKSRKNLVNVPLEKKRQPEDFEEDLVVWNEFWE